MSKGGSVVATAGLTRLSAEATVDEVITVMERDGGVIIEGFLNPDILESVRSDLYPFLAKTSTGKDPVFDGAKTHRLSRLFARTRHVAAIATHPLFFKSAEAFVCRPVDVWHGDRRISIAPGLRIGVTQAIQIGPGETEQPLHRDDTAFMWRHPSGREGRMQIMVAISDFTAENGGTLVIPGSHKWDDERKPVRKEAVSTEMSAGSALLFTGSTYHAGGGNASDQPRTGLTMALDASNVRQEENMYLSLGPEVVRSYPEAIQRLLGWSAGKNHMGWVELDGQMTDPIVLLQGESLTT
jgi:ectoine hydroxylase-related dioxygenase (phytanoyl-CoA dioxygenase family)